MHPTFNDRPARDRFLRENVEAVYHTVTDGMTRFVRVEDLVRDAAEAYPGLLPTREQLAAETGRPLKDKEGWEADQSLLLAHVLADPRCGTHLCHAMLLPRPEAAAALASSGGPGICGSWTRAPRTARPRGASAELQPALSECRGPGDD